MPITQRIILANDIIAMGFHRELVYSTIVKGSVTTAKPTALDDHIHVSSTSGWEEGDIISIGEKNYDRVITSVVSGTEVQISPKILDTEDSATEQVILHYIPIKGHTQNLRITNSMKKRPIHNLEKDDVLHTDIASTGPYVGTIVLKYKMGDDIQVNEEGHYAINSSVIGMSLGHYLESAYSWAKRLKTEEEIPFTFWVRSSPIDGDEGESIFEGCIIGDLKIQNEDEEANVELTIKYRKETVPATGLNILGSLHNNGGRNEIPDSWRGKYFLAQGDNKVELRPCMRVTKIDMGTGKYYMQDTSFFAEGNVVEVRQGDYDELLTIGASVLSIGTDENGAYLILDSTSEDLVPFKCFVVGTEVCIIKSMDFTLDNNPVEIPNLNLDGPEVGKIAGTNQDIKLKLNTHKYDRFLYKIKSMEPYGALLQAEIIFDNMHRTMTIGMYYCIVLSDPDIEYDKEPKLKDEEVEISAADCFFWIESMKPI